VAVAVTWLDGGVAVAGGGSGGHDCFTEAVAVVPRCVVVAAWHGGRGHMA